MTEQKNTTDRRKLRQILISNGYTPLPLQDKGIYIEGWSTVKVDQEWIAGFDRDARYTNTGLRCDRLIAFDIDVLDKDLAVRIEQAIEKEIGCTELCRFGAWPKRLLLYQLTGETGRSLRTGKYGDHRVELLCGPGRQFAAFGRHPSGCDYTWDAQISPLAVPIADLPTCSYVEAQQAIDVCEMVLEATGLEKQRHAYAREFNEHGEAFDLTDEFEILLKVGSSEQETTWGELKSTLDRQGVFGNIKREDGEFGDSDGIHFMLAEGSNQPCAYDFVRDTLHWEPTFQPQKLAEVLPPLKPGAQGKSMFTPDAYQDLVQNWVYINDGTVRHIEDPQRSYKLTHWRTGKLHITVTIKKKKVKKTYPATTIWLKDRNTMRVNYAAMRPDKLERIIKQGTTKILNTYAPPKHPDQGGEIETVREFIEHLIPEAEERDLFWDWHALKMVHPHWRMHALIMVTEAFGTGRGTWNEILQRLFGPCYVRNEALNDLIGSGSQSAYNEYLSDSLIITVNEALEETEEIHGWRARRIAYERLKTLIEPQATKIHIKRKYGTNSDEMVYTSFIFATQHADALAIEPGDRRLIVIDNTTIPLVDAPGDLQTRIHQWKLNPANIGALERALRQRAIDAAYRPFEDPIMTPSKEKMIDIGRGAIEEAYEYMLDNAPGDIVTHQQWLYWANKARDELELELPMGSKVDIAMSKTIKRRAWRIKTLPKSGQIKVQGAGVRPWIIRNRAQWESHTNNKVIAQEIIKNGNPRGATVQKLPDPIK